MRAISPTTITGLQGKKGKVQQGIENEQKKEIEIYYKNSYVKQNNAENGKDERDSQRNRKVKILFNYIAGNEVEVEGWVDRGR